MPKKLTDDIRQRIMDAAAHAFYREGYRAVGVDALAQHAHVSKMTLYRYFPSKDDLIVAVLNAFDANSNAHIAALMTEPATPRAKLMAVFEWIAERASAEDCKGCAFQNGAAEFPSLHNRVHQAALENKRALHAAYLEQAQVLGARAPDVLAELLLLLTDGAWAASRMWGKSSAARSVVAAAAALIDAQL